MQSNKTSEPQSPKQASDEVSRAKSSIKEEKPQQEGHGDDANCHCIEEFEAVMPKFEDDLPK